MSIRQKSGPLSNQQRLVDIAAAQMHLLSILHGGKLELSKFKLYAKPDDSGDELVSFETAFRFISAQSSAKPSNSSKVKFRRSSSRVK